MKSLMIFVALNAFKYSQEIPIAGGVGVSGGFVKQGGFAVGPAAPTYAEGYVDSSGTGSGGVIGGGSFGAVFGGGGNIGGGGGAEVVKTVTVEKHVAPPPLGIGAVGGGSLSFFGGGSAGKHIHAGRAEVISERILEVATEAPLPPAPAKKTVIERTFIPNYVEKRVQVPTYVEKTIRVPTFVEKTIKVPAAPTILEKTISQEDVPAPAHKETKVIVEGAAAIPHQPVYDNVQVYHKVRARPHKYYQKDIISSGGGEGGFVGGTDFIGNGGASGFGSGFGGGGFHAHVGGGGKGLLDGIFNIPIQALGATRDFLSNFSGGVSAHGGVAKGFSTY